MHKRNYNRKFHKCTNSEYQASYLGEGPRDKAKRGQHAAPNTGFSKIHTKRKMYDAVSMNMLEILNIFSGILDG